jgi:hypothetical protein
MRAECRDEPYIINFANSARQESRGCFTLAKNLGRHILMLIKRGQNSRSDGQTLVIFVTISYDFPLWSRLRVRMLLAAFILPREECPEGRTPMAVEGLLFGRQLGECLANLGKIK